MVYILLLYFNLIATNFFPKGFLGPFYCKHIITFNICTKVRLVSAKWFYLLLYLLATLSRLALEFLHTNIHEPTRCEAVLQAIQLHVITFP